MDNSNNTENLYYKIYDKVKEFDNDRNKFKQPIREAGTSDIAGTRGQWRVSSQNFFQDNNAI